MTGGAQVTLNTVCCNQVGSNYYIPSFVGVSQGHILACQQEQSNLVVTIGAAQSSLKLTNPLSKRLNSTTVSSTIMCPFGVGFMEDSNSLLSVAEVR